LVVAGERYAIDVEEETPHPHAGWDRASQGALTVWAPMPARSRTQAAAGDPVAPGDTPVVVEAMKMS
jgi:biotin carboxyl carrier protein